MCVRVQGVRFPGRQGGSYPGFANLPTLGPFSQAKSGAHKLCQHLQGDRETRWICIRSYVRVCLVFLLSWQFDIEARERSTSAGCLGHERQEYA